MRILVDECTPRQIRGCLPDHFVRTAREAGFSGYKNGDLLKEAEKSFDLLITSDQNLRYQQNLNARRIAILLLSTNNKNIILQNGKRILSTVNRMKSSEFVELEL